MSNITKQNVLAIVESIAADKLSYAILAAALIGMVAMVAFTGSLAFPQETGIMPYGSIGQEDQGHAYDENGTLYVNVVFEKGNGQFMTLDKVVEQIKELLE